jgi:hypothetical protein
MNKLHGMAILSLLLAQGVGVCFAEESPAYGYVDVNIHLLGSKAPDAVNVEKNRDGAGTRQKPSQRRGTSKENFISSARNLVS